MVRRLFFPRMRGGGLTTTEEGGEAIYIPGVEISPKPWRCYTAVGARGRGAMIPWEGLSIVGWS